MGAEKLSALHTVGVAMRKRNNVGPTHGQREGIPIWVDINTHAVHHENTLCLWGRDVDFNDCGSRHLKLCHAARELGEAFL